jgi:hypothetical protein
MSVSVLEKPRQLDAPPRRALRPVGDDPPRSPAAPPTQSDFEPWELHSELVLVCPELRRRSLELLPEAADVLVKRPRPVVVVSAPAEEPALPDSSILRYAVRRVGEMVRLGLTIVGAIFVLALLAEVLAR